MDMLLTIIGLLLVVAMCCAIFVFGRQIGFTQRDNEQLKKDFESLEKAWMESQEINEQLEHQLAVENRQTVPEQSDDGWQAFDIRRKA